MSEQSTCGQGLADHADVPLKLADAMGAMAEMLEIHRSALDPGDKRSRPEFDAYVALATEYRELESRLRALAVQMEGYRDLPMAAHDMAVLTSPNAIGAIERMADEEDALARLLQSRATQYRQMLRSHDHRSRDGGSLGSS